MRRTLLATLLLLSGAVCADSPDYREGWAAYQRQDYTTAIRYLVMAADAGDPRAATALADIHERGLGTPKDSEQAFRWRRLAEELGGTKVAARRTDDDGDAEIWRKRALEAEKRDWESREALRKKEEERKRAAQPPYRSNELYWGYGSGYYDPFWGPGWGGWGPGWGYGPSWRHGYGGPGITFGFTQRYRW